MNRIGEKLRHARMRSRMSQAALARRADLGSRATIARIESGRRVVTAIEFVRTLAATDLSVDEFANTSAASPSASFSWRVRSGAPEAAR